MGDIVERLKAIPVWMVGMMAPGWQEHGTAAYKAADEIAALRAENARLTEERDALVEAVERARRHAENIGITDGSYIAQLDAALAKVKGGPDAR